MTDLEMVRLAAWNTRCKMLQEAQASPNEMTEAMKTFAANALGEFAIQLGELLIEEHA